MMPLSSKRHFISIYQKTLSDNTHPSTYLYNIVELFLRQVILSAVRESDPSESLPSSQSPLKIVRFGLHILKKEAKEMRTEHTGWVSEDSIFPFLFSTCRRTCILKFPGGWERTDTGGNLVVDRLFLLLVFLVKLLVAFSFFVSANKYKPIS